MQNWKTKQFIQKAKQIHGDKYNYDKVVYSGSHNKVIITCPTHGDFEQKVNTHLNGSGCPKCANMKQTKTTEQFIFDAKQIHGDKYNYDKVVYSGSNNKVIITCPTHGDFEQIASTHLKGYYCPQCKALYNNKQTTEQFIQKAKETHGNIYNYDKVVYSGSHNKIIITCPTHGDFEQISNNHLNGSGCPQCALKQYTKTKQYTNKQFIQKAKETHGNTYNYDKVVYSGSHNKIIITCPTHGDFEQYPHNHISGKGCSKCGNEILKHSLTSNINVFIQKAKQIHGDKYNYDKSIYLKSRNKIIITCPTHGDFEQIVNNHLNGSGCPQCAILKTIKTTEQFVIEAKQIHGDKYNYDKSIYKHSLDKLTITCSVVDPITGKPHGDFEQQASVHLNGSGCPVCVNKISRSEQEIVDFIKSVYSGIVEQSNRSLLNNLELDIYLPELKIAIEFNGLYWHNENNKPKNYHLQKTEDCEKQNIHLIHIFESEWLHKKDIVKSRLTQIIGINKDKRIYARKCIIKQLDAPTERMFMNNNHLQGYVASNICYGLFYTGTNNKEYLVAAMSFGSLRKNLGSTNVEGCYELYRFCNIRNHSVIGGANKLFKHFIKHFKPKKIISFANRRYSFIHKNIYMNLGFTFESTTPPSYFYIQGTKLINRFALRKDILVRDYGCPINMTEREFCYNQGWFRIYDCGNLKYVYTL